ncbi:Alpha-ribazole-5'-phosphate phosphatase [Raoultella ornithinolytica]|nr:Alpha-ribazole-5'-phosphate phosphatase [Raoultella ornithinolytica]
MRRRTNGESFQHFAHRVRTFAEKLTHDPQPDHLLIVGHKGGLSLLIALLLKLPAEAMWHFPVAHGTWSELELHADFATLRVLNSQARWQKEEEFPCRPLTGQSRLLFSAAWTYRLNDVSRNCFTKMAMQSRAMDGMIAAAIAC